MLVLALLAAFAVVGVRATPASAGTDDYPAPWRAPTAQDSLVDTWGYFNRECTSFVAWRLHSRNGFEMPHAIGDAGAWGTWASAHGYTVNMTPALGSVAWTSGSPGHVAWVESISGSNVTVEQYNLGFDGNYSETTVPTSSVSGFIHFKDLNVSGDYNHDGYSDLHKVVFSGTGSGNVEDHILTGTNFASFLGHMTSGWPATSARDGYYLLGDYNHDNNPDLYKIYLNPSGDVEVHILAGPSYTTSLGDWVTPAGPTSTSQVEVALGDYNGDGYPDLYLVYLNGTGSGQLEVHILDGTNFGSWLGHWVTPAGTNSTNDEEVALSDFNHDGKPDLYIMPTDPGSGHLEVHILDGGGFSTWLGHWVTPAAPAKATYERLQIGDFNHDGYGDIYLIVYDNGGSPDTTDVHILTGTNFGSWLGHWATASGGTPSSQSELLLG